MGCYIETLESKGKAEWIKQNLNGIYLTGRPTHVSNEYVPVCVIDNGQFEAAAIVYDRQEANELDDKADKRKKEWMIIKRYDAIRMCPHVDGKIDW